jgi:hypothetical protein
MEEARPATLAVRCARVSVVHASAIDQGARRVDSPSAARRIAVFFNEKREASGGFLARAARRLDCLRKAKGG